MKKVKNVFLPLQIFSSILNMPLGPGTVDVVLMTMILTSTTFVASRNCAATVNACSISRHIKDVFTS